jgi:acetyltransferase-like isoleucine patch superfamily enzyme
MKLRKIIRRCLSVAPRFVERAIAFDSWLSGSRIRLKGSGNNLRAGKARMRRTFIHIEGANNVLEIGNGTRLFDSMISIRGQGHRVVIGKGCVFNRLELTIDGSGTSVIIGDGVQAAPVRMDVVEPDVSLIIGADCMISRGVEILCSDSHPILDTVSGKRINPPKSVEIGEHVWLGAHVTVLKGSKIGKDTVVGIRSIVCSKIPSGVIVYGNPATVIRSGVTWSR